MPQDCWLIPCLLTISKAAPSANNFFIMLCIATCECAGETLAKLSEFSSLQTVRTSYNMKNLSWFRFGISAECHLDIFIEECNAYQIREAFGWCLFHGFFVVQAKPLREATLLFGSQAKSVFGRMKAFWTYFRSSRSSALKVPPAKVNIERQRDKIENTAHNVQLSLPIGCTNKTQTNSKKQGTSTDQNSGKATERAKNTEYFSRWFRDALDEPCPTRRPVKGLCGPV